MQIRQASKTATVAMAVIVGVLIGVGRVVGIAQSASVHSQFIGVWRISEYTTTGPNARTNTSPPPSIRIFTPRYFSLTDVESDTPRPELPANATDKQRVEAWEPFGAQAGTYDIKGNEITYKRIVAKNPGVMRSGNFQIATFRFEGKDTLWLTTKASDTGRIANPVTFKLVRLE